jgi:hypothetical protein
MLSIQNEIKNLKQDVIQGEQDLNSDVEVAKLETEVKWFAGSSYFKYSQQAHVVISISNKQPFRRRV